MIKTPLNEFKVFSLLHLFFCSFAVDFFVHNFLCKSLGLIFFLNAFLQNIGISTDYGIANLQTAI